MQGKAPHANSRFVYAPSHVLDVKTARDRGAAYFAIDSTRERVGVQGMGDSNRSSGCRTRTARRLRNPNPNSESARSLHARRCRWPGGRGATRRFTGCRRKGYKLMARLPPKSLESLITAVIEQPEWARNLLADLRAPA